MSQRAGKKAPGYELRLFVAGTAFRSMEAIRKVKEFCETYLKGQYSLRVIDLYQQPELAAAEQIVATPTLVRGAPRPKRFLVGSLVSAERFIQALDLGGVTI